MIHLKDVEDEKIKLVAQEIREGKIAIFPTETVYGIGTNAFNKKACERIYEIKRRPSYKPLIVLVGNEEMLYEVIQNTNEIEKKLIERFWPGPLTIIFEKKARWKISTMHYF